MVEEIRICFFFFSRLLTCFFFFFSLFFGLLSPIICLLCYLNSIQIVSVWLASVYFDDTQAVIKSPCREWVAPLRTACFYSLAPAVGESPDPTITRVDHRTWKILRDLPGSFVLPLYVLLVLILDFVRTGLYTFAQYSSASFSIADKRV